MQVVEWRLEQAAEEVLYESLRWNDDGGSEWIYCHPDSSLVVPDKFFNHSGKASASSDKPADKQDFYYR